jgi:hypothetical protein
MSESFNITPPSLHLIDAPSLWFVGFCEDDIEKLSRGFDSIFDKGAVYYHTSDSIDSDTLGWARAVSTMCNTIIVNVDTVVAEELFVVLKSKELTNPNIVWISELNINPNIRALISSYNDDVAIATPYASTVLESIDHMFDAITSFLNDDIAGFNDQ